MFGSGKIKNLENQLSILNQKYNQVTKEKDKLSQDLDNARRKVKDLEARLASFDLDQAIRECDSKKAEYEGLKDLYTQKISEFDAEKDGKEQEFARFQAVQRFDLDNEIKENREANQNYVADTIKSFSESYNYYLSQIKQLMDALSDVATQTGKTLFTEPSSDLKAKIGVNMAERLKVETDSLRHEPGEVILIGSTEEFDMPAPLEVPAEIAAPAAEPEVKKAPAKKPAARKPAGRKTTAKKTAGKSAPRKAAVKSPEAVPAPEAEAPAEVSAAAASVVKAVSEAVPESAAAKETLTEAAAGAAEDVKAAVEKAADDAAGAAQEAAGQAAEAVEKAASELQADFTGEK